MILLVIDHKNKKKEQKVESRIGCAVLGMEAKGKHMPLFSPMASSRMNHTLLFVWQPLCFNPGSRRQHRQVMNPSLALPKRVAI